MRVYLDHLVHFVYEDLTLYTNKLMQSGLPVIRGGSHVKWGTHNSLLYVNNNAYIEWIGVNDPKIARQAENPLIQHLVKKEGCGGHLAQIAFRVERFEEFLKNIQEKEIPYQLVDGSRKREDGTLMTWKMLFLNTTTAGMEPPFFIEWGREDQERRQELQEQGWLNKDLEIPDVYFAVRDVDLVLKEWNKWYPIYQKVEWIKEEWKGKGVRLQFENAGIVLLEPTAVGMVSNAIEKYGEGPFHYELVKKE
ncbi:VOC family protein [Bacillus carboniphilus]|uniref:VOC family protein n=1 Tax=Bacillus carboniphilus TaxID=86663 RepID=A0ABP3FJK7_9BACI